MLELIRHSDELRTIDEEDVMVSPEAKEVIDRVNALSKLDLPPVHIFEIDDGPEGYALLSSLIAYTDSFGGGVIRCDQDATKMTIGKESGGTYLAYIA